MNKADLVRKISKKSGLSNTESKDALEAALEAVKEALAAGDNVSLTGFGTFSVAERPEREGYNPIKGERYVIPAKKAVKFKPSEAMVK